MYRKRDFRLTLSQGFVCSSIAGFASKTLTAPIDVLKIRTQVGTSETRHGILNSIISIHRREGIRAFWKGNLTGCIRLIPYSTIQLAAFQNFRTTLADSCGRLCPTSALVAGAGAGLVATVVMYPTDTIKTRLIAQHSKKRWATYKGITHAFREIVSTEGITALYRGLSTSLMGTIPYTATMFMSYEVISRINSKSCISTTPAFEFFEGCLASAMAQVISYPFDTIRKKMQAYSSELPNRGGVDVQASTVRQTFQEVVNRQGVRGLWRGLSINLVRIAPYTGLMFYIFESCKKFFLYHNGFTLSPFQQIHHPLIDQSLRPQDVDDESEDWIVSEED